MAYVNNSVYWVGQDGNVYFKNGTTVKNVGKPINLYQNGFDSNGLSAEASLIADPNPGNGAPAAPANPNGSSGGGSSAPTYADKSADIALQNAALGSADAETQSGLSAVDKALGGLTGQYDADKTANEGDYTGKSQQNQGALQKNKQVSLVNAAQGRRGLFGTLASLGALGGTGIELANRAVQEGANKDLGDAADTYSQNQSVLDDSITKFRREDEARRQQAAQAAEDAKTNVKNTGARNKLAALSALSNDYTAQGDTANAKKYADMAGALFPEIAQTNVPSGNLGYVSAAYTPTSLANYLAGANSTQVSVDPNAPTTNGIPTLVANNRKKVTV